MIGALTWHQENWVSEKTMTFWVRGEDEQTYWGERRGGVDKLLTTPMRAGTTSEGN